MNRKAAQTAAGVLVLLVWGAWGVRGVPASRLEQLVNIPNPFDSRSGVTQISYQLSQDARVSIRLYDLLGGSVRSWEFTAGESGARQGLNRVAWDGADESGRKVAAGGYICQVVAEEPEGVVQGIRKIAVLR